jgi:uncharacterized membrane protein
VHQSLDAANRRFGPKCDIFLTRNAVTGRRAAGTSLKDDAMKRYVTVGLTVLAGVALFEVALVPGVVIGGAAVLAPKYLPKLRKRLRPLLNATVHRPAKPAAPLREDRLDAEVPAAVLPKFAIGQAIAKTITFRIIVTTLDFTTNYLVIGELGTAAGLSTFNLVAGPLFYLGHEAAWSYLGPSEAALDLPVPAPLQRAGGGGFTISRALAKTVTFRTIATAMDFTTNYVVVGDAAAAVVLSASGFILGPFVYFGHERAWDYFSAPRERTVDPPASIKLLPAPG